MRLRAAVFVAVGFVALSSPAGALAEVQTMVFDSSPVTIGPFGVARDVQLAPSPKVDGYVVGMKASLVDGVGNAVGESRTSVKPIWLDVRNCRADPIFNVPGTGGSGSTYIQRADWVAPESGVLVAGGAHLHGGGDSVDVADTSCGSIYTSYPIWGGIEPRPVMHE